MNLDGNQRTDDNNETPLYIDHFFGGFLILFVGYLISLVVFVTERCCLKEHLVHDAKHTEANLKILAVKPKMVKPAPKPFL